MSDAIWISEDEVTHLMTLAEALLPLTSGLKRLAEGSALNLPKTQVGWGSGNLHAIGSVFTGSGLAATKTWAHTEGGACPLLILIDTANGSIRAIVEAFALGQLRTSGISALATQLLAPQNAQEMALIGSGKQALAQVAAVAAVRPLKRVRVYSPRPDHRKAFIERARRETQLEWIEATRVEEAVEGVPVVTTVTRATTPLLSADMLARGTHINAVGAISLERTELAQDVFDRTTRIAVDNKPDARRLAAEFIARFGDDREAWQAVQPLSQLIATGDGRQPGDDLSIFKAMGMGVSDLALGQEIYQRARARGIGRPFPQPTRSTPVLFSHIEPAGVCTP